ncbi:glucan biosynthesis protein [Methylocella sp.]|uniref:glucan biosynthesis protein n=1 Tax=Methylocella sp. TaxID=1978226 RepID=UPI0035B1E58A
MIDRRGVLRLSLAALAAPAAARAQGEGGSGGAAGANPAASGSAEAAPTAFPLADPTPFSPDMATNMARALAQAPFKPVAAGLPDPFKSLSYDQYVGVHLQPGAALWTKDNVGFAIEPLHRGFIFSTPMRIDVVEDGVARRLVYDSRLFDFGKPGPTGIGDIGFSGFRVLAPLEDGGFFELATFQGASFFRAVGRGLGPGPMARALAIKTADPAGEEFPFFRQVWIVRPTLADAALTIYAIIDSESVAGAYRFTLRPGETTLIDTESTLFARAALDHYGVAAMSATHVTGAIDRGRSDDLRPQVAEADGLQMLTGGGEWIWRPVSNPSTLQVSSFVDDNPRGFGLLQRDRDFSHYQDDDQHWENRPSLWIEPIGEWGAGAVQLVEIPSDAEVNDNIISYWRPKQTLPAKGEIAFAYRQFWRRSPPERPPLAAVSTSRSGRGSNGRRRRFVVEFSGGALASIRSKDDIAVKLSAAPGSIASQRTFFSPGQGVFRVLFELDPGGDVYSELRLVLEAQGKPISETWIYRWTA